MIRYLAEEEKINSMALYQEAFPEDPQAFVEYYYSCITKDNKILVMEQAGTICSMLHLNPYRLSVGGNEVAAYYYVAVATKKGYRHQGMMRRLLGKSLNDIRKEGHPFTYLMPANRAIYEPFDFRIIYCQKKVELPHEPAAANELMAKQFDVYTIRDDWYVEKMMEEERVCQGNPPFDIVPYIMARITHVEEMLSLLRSETKQQMILNIKDELIEDNNGSFYWEVSPGSSVCKKMDKYTEGYQVNIAELTEFVFGKRELTGFEHIKTFDRICINESV